jgi:hypothetical protein
MALHTPTPRAGLTHRGCARRAARGVIIGAIHLAALVVLYETEWGCSGALAVLIYLSTQLCLADRPASAPTRLRCR